MYKNLLTLVSLIILLFAVSCGGGGAALPDPGQQGGGNGGNGGGNGGAPVIPVDDIAPEIVLSGLTEGSSYGLQEAGVNVLNVKGVAADPSGITNMALRINDTLVASSNDSQVGFDWDVTGFSDGTYEVVVQAADGEGNIASSSMTVYVDNVAWVFPGLDLFPDLPLEVFDPGLVDPFPVPDPFPFPDFPVFPGI
jgi:hypothetical protein